MAVIRIRFGDSSCSSLSSCYRGFVCRLYSFYILFCVALKGGATQEASESILVEYSLANAVQNGKMATTDSKAPIRVVKRVQFGILSPDEIVSKSLLKL